MYSLKRLAERLAAALKRLAERLAAAIDRLNDIIGATIRWLALVMVLVGAATAILRYSARGLRLSLNLNPPTEVQWYLFSLIFLLGAAYGLRHDVHVRVDVLYSQLSRKARARIDLAGHILFLVPFSVVMLYVSWPMVRNSWSVLEVSPDPGGLPRYPIKTVIIISFVLLLAQGYSQILKQVRIIRAVDEADSTAAPEPEAPA